MSEPNVETVRRLYQLTNDGDLSAVLKMCPTMWICSCSATCLFSARIRPQASALLPLPMSAGETSASLAGTR